MKKNKTIQRKVIASILLVGMVPGIVIGMLTYIAGITSLRDSIGANFQEIAKETADKVEIILNKVVQDAQSLAISPYIKSEVIRVNGAYEGKGVGKAFEKPLTKNIPGKEPQGGAMNPGLYIYHCATSHIPTHIANGMYGLILVEPEKGLPRVDHEYYVVQGDFYTAGKFGEKGFQPYSVEKGRMERAEYVVFNGSVGSLTGKGALKAKSGETVRLYVGNGGPNLVSAFHVIGEIFDTVYQEGAVGSDPARNVQTTMIPPGGAAIVEFKVDVPGSYLLVDHSIFRAIDKGAVGILDVTWKETAGVFQPLKTGSNDSGH